MSGETEGDRSTPLVEHFFRHEYGNLVAVLTRAFGIGRIDLVEDMVQQAMLEAMNAWGQKGTPDNPAGWIHRVAKNRILDQLRREKVHERAMAMANQTPEAESALVDEWLDVAHLPDSLLRMIFVCCHPSLDRASQIALTLKVLSGFGIAEIASGLLMSRESIKKRIQRAKKHLADSDFQPDLPPETELAARLQVVHEVLYLMFNEGYSASRGPDPIRDDLCEEAARLCHMICLAGVGTHATSALLALMLFQGSRLEARVDENGDVILLEDQDRTKWDQGLIREGLRWIQKAGGGGTRTHYHLEAGIAMYHCRAQTFEETDWAAIAKLYDILIKSSGSPVYILNRAVALAQDGHLSRAFEEIESIRDHPDMSEYVLLDSVEAKLHQLSGKPSAAIDCLLTALSRNPAAHEKELIKRKIAALTTEAGL